MAFQTKLHDRDATVEQLQRELVCCVFSRALLNNKQCKANARRLCQRCVDNGFGSACAPADREPHSQADAHRVVADGQELAQFAIGESGGNQSIKFFT